MKHFLFITILFFVVIINPDVLNAKIKSGIYSDESGSTIIVVSGDTLKISSASGIESNTCLAVCECKEISESFVEINSIVNPIFDAYNNISITYSNHSENVNNSDSNAIVNFILPNTSAIVEFHIYCGTVYYTKEASNGICQISLNRNRIDSPKSFSFVLRPLYYTESNPDAQFYGLLFYLYPYEIEYSKGDIITIELPSVTDNLFDQYYIKGEYIYLTCNGFQWRGESFYYERDLNENH